MRPVFLESSKENNDVAKYGVDSCGMTVIYAGVFRLRGAPNVWGINFHGTKQNFTIGQSPIAKFGPKAHYPSLK